MYLGKGEILPYDLLTKIKEFLESEHKEAIHFLPRLKNLRTYY